MHRNENFTTEINSTHFDLRSESKNHLVSFLSYLRFLYCFRKKGTIYVLLFSSMSSKPCFTVIGCRIYMYSFKFRKKYFHAIALFIEVATGILIIKVEKILKGSMDSIPSL